MSMVKVELTAGRFLDTVVRAMASVALARGSRQFTHCAYRHGLPALHEIME